MPPEDGNQPSQLKEDIMTFYFEDREFEEEYEYDGNTAVQRVRRKNGQVEHQWLHFDSVEEAADFFYDHFACCEAA
jgi:hypothetical protein